jgi:hypothetical protein
MTATQFWRLTEPEYGSDYEHTYINGGLEHPYSLPGVKCDVCGQTWGGSRVLPFPCPQDLRARPELQVAWPIEGPKHRALRAEVAEHLAREGFEAGPLFPGDDFQPAFLDVPSSPSADFLWASRGSVVVSDRIRTVLGDLTGANLAFAPVILRNIGKGDPHDEIPIPSTGEPEDMYGEVELRASNSDEGQYWEMIVQSESRLPRGVNEVMPCNGCGRRDYDHATRILSMFPDMWRGAPIFTLATTLWIVVTDAVRQQLLAMSASNVAFRAA